MINIPDSIKPRDGRFGCGPSKIRDSAIDNLSTKGRSILGTSHRQKAVKSVVGEIRQGLNELFSLPEGYEILLGNVALPHSGISQLSHSLKIVPNT